MEPKSIRFALLLLTLGLLAACSQVPSFDGNVTGRVTTSDGAALSDATVTAASTSSGDAAALSAQALDTTLTDGDGYFDLSLPNGRYVLLVVGGGQGVTRIVDVTDAGVELTLRADRVGHVRGKVLDSNGEAAEGAQVRARGTHVGAHTTEDGDYALNGLPAGDYRLAASDEAGSRATEVEVSVVAGSTVEAPTLALQEPEPTPGPSISGASTDLLFFNQTNLVYGTPMRVEITGSGFGETMGLNRLLYGGNEVNAQAISSWSDSSIVVETQNPFHLLGNVIGYPLLQTGEQEAESEASSRFEVRTQAGVATSEPVRLAAVYLDVSNFVEPGAEATVRIELEDAYGRAVEGREFMLEANRGTLASDAVNVGASGVAEVAFTPESREPHVVSVRYDGTLVTTAFGQCCDVDVLQDRVDAGASAAVTVRVSDEAGQVLDAGAEFDVAVLPYGAYYYWGYEAREAIPMGGHATDVDGEFELDVSGLDAGMDYEVYLLRDGAIVGDSEFFWVDAPGVR